MTDGTPSGFAGRLRRLRESAGLTQEELAERAGLTAKGIAALERGRSRRPYPQTVRAISDALGLTEAERAALIEMIPGRDVPPAASRQPWPSLPAPPTPLIGREREQAEVRQFLCSRETRLITLTGPGGVGKTRLALEVASSARADFSDGVVFVALAPLRDPAHVIPTIAQTLRLTETGGQTIEEMLISYLSERRLLVVLDNVEHVLDAARDIARLLAACPDLMLLATSRVPLRIRGERMYPVSPLALPGLSHMPTPDEVMQASAAQLFVERAQSWEPTFELRQSNCAAVAAICRRLDGLPLALELAAARVRVLSPVDLLARLDRSLSLLHDGARDLPERQQTLRAAISWSYELLSSEDQTLFRRLMVFSGGWTLEAAEAVVANGDESDYVLDSLARLVDHHLVLSLEPAERSIRFGMLETIREFAADRLRESGEEAAIRQRHARFFLALAERCEREHWQRHPVSALAQVEAEYDNLRAALEWSIGTEETTLAVRLSTALWGFWWAGGHFREGREWIERVVCRAAAAPASIRARALVVAAALAGRQGDIDQAVTWLNEGLRLHRNNHDDDGIALALYHLAFASLVRDDIRDAITLLEESLEHARAAVDTTGIIRALCLVGHAQHRQGNVEQAQARLDEALALARQAQSEVLLVAALGFLGYLAQDLGDDERAMSHYHELLQYEWIEHEGAGLIRLVANLAVLLVDTGRPRPAIRLMGAAEQLREAFGAGALALLPSGYRSSLAAARASLGEQEFEATWEAGRRSSRDELIAEARRITSRSARVGDGSEAMLDAC